MWEALSMLEKVLYIIASTSTIILVIQTILALFGIGEDTDTDTDVGDTDLDVDTDISETGINPFDLAGLKILTIRGVMSFFAIGGWTAILCLYSGLNKAVSLLLGLAAGTITMVLLAKLIQISMKLQSDGNISIQNAIGKSGVVYLRIPSKGNGQGKVNILIQERLREYDAITYENDTIPTGANVIVKEVVQPDILVVEKVLV